MKRIFSIIFCRMKRDDKPRIPPPSLDFQVSWHSEVISRRGIYREKVNSFVVQSDFPRSKSLREYFCVVGIRSYCVQLIRWSLGMAKNKVPGRFNRMEILNDGILICHVCSRLSWI